MTINERLNNLYNLNLTGIIDISNHFNDNLDGPHLMYCLGEKQYIDADKKIVFIGQEPNTWIFRAWDEIEESLKRYKEFGLAKEAKYVTPFWRALKLVNKTLNPNLGQECFFWTNVSKYSTYEGKKVKESEFEFINQKLNILQEEIKILNPDVVIFFSGPNYDNWINPQFDGEIKFEQVNEDIPKKELARLIHKDLPKHTYRTYHPSSLQRQKKWNYIQLIVNYILEYDPVEIFKTFRTQIYNIAEELDLEIDGSSEFNGLVNTGFYLNKKNWENCAIGFEFERSWASDFFYGICRKNMNTKISQTILTQINQYIENADGHNEFWPWWKWFKNRDWDYNSLIEIENGNMEEEIKTIVKKLIEKLEKISDL